MTIFAAALCLAVWMSAESAPDVLDQLQRGAPQILNKVFNYTQTVLSGTATVLAAMVFVPMMTLYLMLDTVRLRKALVHVFPEHHQDEVDGALQAVSKSLSGYIRSRVLLALFMWGSAYLESGRVAIYLLLEVVGAVISAALLTDDPFGWREGAGCLLIVGAGLLEGLDELRRRRLPIARPA